jgi:hypothetical protein
MLWLVLGGPVLAESDAAVIPHSFDPVLSLTGSCAVAPVDPVPDPGCPASEEGKTPLSSPRSVTTDMHGNIYVASFGPDDQDGEKGKIDIFDAEGQYIDTVPNADGPKSVAIDTLGNLYVFVASPSGIYRYEPSEYEPATGQIDYANAPVLVTSANLGTIDSLEINRANNHLFVHYGARVREYTSAADGNKLQSEDIGVGIAAGSNGLAIDVSRSRIYAADNQFGQPRRIRVFELASPYNLVDTIDASDIPPASEESAPEFGTDFYSLAIDEETGHLFVYVPNAGAVYELSEDGEYIETIKYGLAQQGVFGAEIAIDNGTQSPNGALNTEPVGRYLYVPAYPSSNKGRLLAFGPTEECELEIKEVGVGDVTEDEAELQATIDPCSLETTYSFQYTTLESYEEEGFAGAQSTQAATLPAVKQELSVTGVAEGLAPGTAYRFRVVAESALGEDEDEGGFATYPAAELEKDCPNGALRSGPSVFLPDCRAYELVTPPETNAHAPIAPGTQLGLFFPSYLTSPEGTALTFLTEGGPIPGFGGAGAQWGDRYLASRGATGWNTASSGPDGVESSTPYSGSASTGQGYSFWQAGGEGTAVIDNTLTAYLRYPDGHSELIGRGSLGDDIEAQGRLISDNGEHVLFTSEVHLELESPPDGTQTVYDRTAGKVTHVVSLLPGDVPQTDGQNASYVGASLDGEGVAFEIGNTLYLRHHNEETYEVGDDVTFAGIAEGGERIFYVEEGKLFAFDIDEGVIPFNATGSVTPVNVSADGTAAYFVSTTELIEEANPSGQLPEDGEQNLYHSEEGTISFVGIVTAADVGAEPVTPTAEGLGYWTTAVGKGRFGQVTSRTTPDGSALLFESEAALSAYDSEGHEQVYRYDSVADVLQCLSCNPTGALATGEASLRTGGEGIANPMPLNFYPLLANLRADGGRAFFQSTEALVSADTDGLQDVYEWEDQGVGSCKRPGGCVYLISHGRSEGPDYLYAVSETGNDVFFRTADQLLGVDAEPTASIYDARVGGGFPEAPPVICQGEGCRPTLAPPPALAPPASPPGASADDNVKPRKSCPKGKRKVKRGGKVRCVKKKQRGAGANRKGGRK